MIVWPLGQGTPTTTAIERVTAPAVEPITPAEAKAHLRVVGDHDDDLIGSLVNAAVDLLDGEGRLGRAMITQSWAQWFAQSPGRVRLTMGPFQSLTSVEYYDASGTLQSASAGDFEIRKDRDFVTIGPKDGATWPAGQTRADAIKVTYVAGFGDAGDDVPVGIRQALLLVIGHWYENREGVTDLNMRELPMAVEALIDRHRVGWYG